MTKRMLIDATHAEETRVVVLDGNRLEDFDVETAAKQQLKGNIYLAKVVRVEPSLQAAFVEYGGGRHGFLAFGEIHPDYYQIPVADRQRLMEMQEAEARAEEEADDAAAAADEAAERAGAAVAEERATPDMAPLGVHNEAAIPGHAEAENTLPAIDEGTPAEMLELPSDAPEAESAIAIDVAPLGVHGAAELPGHAETEHELAAPADPAYGAQDEIAAAIEADLAPVAEPAVLAEPAAEPGLDESGPAPRAQPAEIAQDIIVGSPDAYAEVLGADLALEAMEPATPDAEFAPQPAPVAETGGREDEQREEEPREARPPARFMRSYKIQEVIRRRQILLIQVVKEERGSKGAALTTYISLAGRFSVLMPNSPRGGGISRKITSTADRRRLKEVTNELQIPRGMGLIVRTAGANRPKAEIKRDCEYLLELWDSIRETTMKSIAPALIHEEANLIKRAIRDNYSRDVDEVLVDGEAGWRAARDFMRMLMPAHARKVVLWNNPQPLFAHQAVEAQLDSMLVPTVQLRSGGYLVINQTEALVAVDVNSGRSTRERGIEETALKTNLEAADEVARQLRLRDLAGLIVIDFIDMESRRNNAAVEKRMKDALKDDRARIQLGSISSFGLMEMSRQRLRPSLAETSFTPCPHCGGTGHVRSTETSALAVLRAIEDEGAKRRAAEICVYVAGAIALYVLNHKRVRIAEIEARYSMMVSFAADESLLPPQTRIERLRAQTQSDALEPAASPVTIPIREIRPIDADDEMAVEEEDEADDEAPEAEAVAAAPAPSAEPVSEGEARKRRRRRRGGRREDGVTEAAPSSVPLDAVDPALADQPDLPELPLPLVGPAGEGDDGGISAAAAEEARGRRRGRRGGRRRRRDEPGGEPQSGGEPSEDEAPAEDALALFDAPPPPAYVGPTPADPFGGGVFDIYDVMEQAEARAAASPPAPGALPSKTFQHPEPEAGATIADVEAGASEVEPDAEDAPAAVEAAPVDAFPSVPLEPVVVQPVPTEPTVAEILPESEVDGAREPAPDVIAQPAPEEPAAAAFLPEVEVNGASEPPPEMIAQPVPVAHAAVEILPEPPVARPEPVAGPISAPVIIGADSATGDKKRGWWKR